MKTSTSRANIFALAVVYTISTGDHQFQLHQYLYSCALLWRANPITTVMPRSVSMTGCCVAYPSVISIPIYIGHKAAKSNNTGPAHAKFMSTVLTQNAHKRVVTNGYSSCAKCTS